LSATSSTHGRGNKVSGCQHLVYRGADAISRKDFDMKMSTEEVEVRVWAVIALSLTGILVSSVIGIILGVLFVEHDMERISPIDTQFMAILKDIMLLCIGAVGGIVGRKGAYAAANMISKDKDDPTRPAA
jgi:branched-subunit amino acid permease